MKKFRLIAAALIAAMLLTACAFADVKTTGNVNLRSGPGLAYDIVTSLSEGRTLDFLDDYSTDERGVDWYLVDHKGTACWISSKYAQLVGEELPVKAEFDLSNLENFMEVSVWFDQNLEEAAAAIGLTDYAEVNMESPRQYSNEYLTIAASATIEYIGLTGGEYTIFGVACGMDRETALNKMVEAGMSVLRDDAAMIVVEHPAAEDSFIDIEGFDSCINLEINNGVVTRMDWSGYTG